MNAPTVSSGADRRKLVAGVAAVAALSGAGWAWWRSQKLSPNDVALQAFWALQLQTPDGGPLALQQFAGKPLLVNFWATWCPPCVRELPMLSAFAQQQSGIPLLGLAVDQAAPVQKFLARQSLAFPVAMAGAGGSGLTRSLGNVQGGLPFSILFTADGNVKQRKMGELSEADLQAWARAI